MKLDPSALPAEDPSSGVPVTDEARAGVELEMVVAARDGSEHLAEKRAEIIKALKQDRKERKRYAGKIFVLICAWLGIVLGIVVMAGFKGNLPIRVNPWPRSMIDPYRWEWTPFELPETVLLALIGGTTVTVLGLFAIVANYLFPRKAAIVATQGDEPGATG